MFLTGSLMFGASTPTLHGIPLRISRYKISLFHFDAFSWRVKYELINFSSRTDNVMRDCTDEPLSGAQSMVVRK